ncbi:MAG: HDOD domain-containing protein [Salinibacterium sp.]|nr:HDOD domain-containing protein [Salinibacterium sp.]
MPETLTMPQAPMTRERARLELVLGQLDELPTLSPVATRLLSLGSDDDVDLDSIVSLIEADPTLTGKILGLCRRAGLAVTEQITTVKHAAVMLGLETVRSAVLSVAVYEALEAQGQEADERALAAAVRLGSDSLASAAFDRTGFWRYSIGVAAAAELIAAERREPGLRPQEAFVAGLLAEIGKLMLDFAVPKGYARVLGYAERQGLSASEAAEQLLGIDHHSAGAHVAGRWGLPEALIEIIRGTQARDGDPLMGVVGSAVALCRGMHIGFSGEPAGVFDSAAVASTAGVTPQAMASIVNRLHESVSERCGVLGLDEVSTHDMLMQSIARANRQLDTLNQSLTHRSRAADSIERTMAAIEWFGRATAEHTSERLAGAIAVSAARVIGGDRWALVRREAEH